MTRPRLLQVLAPVALAVALVPVTASLGGATTVPVRSRRSPALTAVPVAPSAKRARPPVPTRDAVRIIGIHVLYARAPRHKRGPGPGPPVLGSSCTTPGAGTSEYSLEGWKIPSARTAHFNASTTPSGLSNVAGSLQAAFSAWSSSDSRAPQITVASDGTTTAPTADHQNELMFGSVGGGALAVTYTWKWSSGEVESDMLLNSNTAWFQAPGEGSGCYPNAAYDVQDIATHEAGHAYGLAHANSSPFNTMYPTAATGETYKRSLAPGDIAGLQAIY